jgi:hypothetical protein
MTKTKMLKLFARAYEFVEQDIELEGAIDAFNTAFDAAKEFGWNPHQDVFFQTYSLKATREELLDMALYRCFKRGILKFMEEAEWPDLS